MIANAADAVRVVGAAGSAGAVHVAEPAGAVYVANAVAESAGAVHAAEPAGAVCVASAADAKRATSTMHAAHSAKSYPPLGQLTQKSACTQKASNMSHSLFRAKGRAA